MKAGHSGALLVTTLLLAACADAERDPGAGDARGMIEEAVETQRRPLERAGAVEQQLQDAQQRRLEQIDAQSDDA